MVTEEKAMDFAEKDGGRFEMTGNEKKCCGTCIYHKKEDIDQGWVCVDPDSEHCADWTEYGDSCEDWEGWTTIGVPGGCD